ncbi:MAG: amidohydrolase family protein [Pseudomonadales bacterium]|nr:amidohydrolase family protein [Pseudomonadales bacterium]
MAWDLIVKNARVFDGSGTAGRDLDIAVSAGKIAALGENLPEEAATFVDDVRGAWMTPGLLDIHTHEDLEAELDPGLPEVVRHGTTSVVVGNCSIGLAFGNQRRNDQDPIVDCFARVENIPKPVLRRAAEKAVWDNPQDYLNHLDELPLAVNMAPFLPHSMLRIEVMGLDDSVNRDPTKAEIDRMAGILEEAMQAGYLGMSTDGLPLHFLANQPNLKKRIPTQYARYAEYKTLTDVVRRHDRVWQMTPATDDGGLTVKLFMLSSGRLHGKPLKITALAALDSVGNRQTKAQALLFANLLNSRLMDGNFRMQCLAAPFRIYSEGAVSPLAEANPLMRQLIETELEDVAARRAILSDPEWIEAFRTMWSQGKSGFNLDHLRRKLRLERQFLSRDLNDMMVFRVPVRGWIGQSLQFAYERYNAWMINDALVEDEEEIRVFNALGREIRDDGEFFVMLLRHYDRDLYWSYVNANKDPKVVKELLLHPKLLPGFNDSGAHVTNMAYFDGNLRALHLGMTGEKDDQDEHGFSRMVRRLTSEPADFFGLDVGRIKVGARADLTLLNPEALKTYDGEASVRLIDRDLFGCEQLVNRSDGVVDGVYVHGQKVWQGTDFTPTFRDAGLGDTKLGAALRVKN